VVGDGGLTIARSLDIPVTTGDAYTIAVAVRAVREAAQALGIDLPGAHAAVVGATGAIGQVCAELLCQDVATLSLVARDPVRLSVLGASLQAGNCAQVQTSTDLAILKEAHLILTVSSSAQPLIEPGHLRPGSVVCDVARPRDVSARVAATRKDVLVIDGGMVDVPGPVNFNFDFGFPPGKAYACMAETMALALDGRLEDYTVGKQIERSRVTEISAMCDRHGFRLSGFRSFEKPVSEAQIQAVRRYNR
jgi:predicted amino acid dehydrogenase